MALVLRIKPTIRPYNPKTSAKIRTNTMATKSLGW